MNTNEVIQEIKNWIDVDGLIGGIRNPTTKWTSGNSILETAFACNIINQYNKTIKSIELLENFKKAVLNCRSENGLYNKNPGRPDEITFDCLIGAAYISQETAKVITNFGRKNFWIMSNTGKLYFTAISRPQYIAYYKICAQEKPSIFQLLLLYIDLLFLSKTTSGLRLQYLIADKIKEYSELGSFLYQRIMRHIKRKYGSLAKLHEKYYNNSSHFNVICNKL